MRILFLHLSDAHINANTNLQEINIAAIVNSLVQLGEFDECLLIFSGDITYSGEKNAYKKAGQLIGRLAKSISERYIDKKYVNTLIVPGNHDNLVKNKERDNLEIEKYYKDNEVDLKFAEDMKELSNFYEFAIKNHCFRRNKIIDVKKITFDNFTIKAHLINSAPFSLLGGGARDKGVHYIPNKDYLAFNMELNEKYTISIIHHSPEWFCDKSKRRLYDCFNESTDLLFMGHEHYAMNEDKSVNGKHIDVSSGIALYGTDEERGYNALILDTEKHSLVGYKYIYNGRIYKPIKILENNNVVFTSNCNYRFTEEFQQEILTDCNERCGEYFDKYFVFPSLEAKSTNSDLKNYTVTSEENFLELFNLKSRISIEGSVKSGKSTLAKYMCNLLADKYVTLYLTTDSFLPRNVNNVLKYALQNQYGDNVDCDDFEQLDPSQKVLIVDGSDKVEKEKWDKFYSTYANQFGHIIVFCGVDWNLNIKDRALEELTDTSFFYLKICPFYYLKREQLIKKICVNYLKENPALDIDEKCKKINDDITSQIKFFQLTPGFIHQFVDYYIQFSHIKTHKETNVFSKVYVTNITYRISKNTKEDNDVDEIMVALDYVAHFIHFVKGFERISYEEFEGAISSYKEKYDNRELNPRYVRDVAVKANILKESTDMFELEFCDENLLAYFVAQHLNRSCQNAEKPEDLKYVLDNICFGINGDILLFLSYITSNTQILTPILQSIVNHMDGWEELDLDANNVEYLSKITYQTTPKLPSHKEKEHIKEQQNEIEKEYISEKENQVDSLYSYDKTKVNSFSNRVAKSINYLDLIAKILPNFRHILTGDEKKIITEILYTYPNKLLYFMLKDIDANFDTIINDILKMEPKTRKGLLITSDMISKELQNQSMAYILSIYDFIASTATNGKTLGDLEKFDFNQNTNYQIQNLMMQENMANFKTFASRAEIIFNNAKLNITRQMVSLIVRKYFIYHDVEMHGEAIRLVDKFFGEEQRKKYQIVQAKNKIIKK